MHHLETSPVETFRVVEAEEEVEELQDTVEEPQAILVHCKQLLIITFNNKGRREILSSLSKFIIILQEGVEIDCTP